MFACLILLPLSIAVWGLLRVAPPVKEIQEEEQNATSFSFIAPSSEEL